MLSRSDRREALRSSAVHSSAVDPERRSKALLPDQLDEASRSVPGRSQTAIK